MNAEGLLDEVRSRLSNQEPHSSFADAEVDLDQHFKQRRIDVSDLDAIADRHYRIGYTDGVAEGMQTGAARGQMTGRAEQHARDSSVLEAITDSLQERLRRVEELVAPALKGTRDRETKEEIRQMVVDRIAEIRGGLAVITSRARLGEFDA